MGLRTIIRRWQEKGNRIKDLKDSHRIKTDAPTTIFREKIEFPHFDQPKISIVIPFFNQELCTWNCLKSITQYFPQISFEIILVDDNSNEYVDFSLVENIRLVRNEEILGFSKSVNKGIAFAKGEYIYLLSNQTIVRNGFLDELYYTFQTYPNVGAVTSKILNKKGDLLEAGCVFTKNFEISPNITARSYFPEVNYIHKVDSTSGCSIMFKKNTDENSVNILDEQFATSPLAITDFCFHLKYKQGKDIYYNPFSEIVQYNNNFNRPKHKLSKKDLPLFNKKWKVDIDNIQAGTSFQRVIQLYNNKSIVIFYYQVPEYDNNSGDLRLTEIIKAFKKLGYHITLISEKNKTINSYTRYFQHLGVCTYYEHLLYKNLPHFLNTTRHTRPLCWFYTADVFINFYKEAQEYFKNAKLVYDMVDVHHLRFQRASQKEPDNQHLLDEYKKALEHETAASKLADIVVPISATEAAYMERFCSRDKIIIISNIHYPKIKIEDTPAFEEREGLLFIGSIHHPNADAVQYLMKDIMPIVWKTHPNIALNIIGNVKNYFTDAEIPQNIHFHGFVPDITKFFLNCKMMIAPLRYGAGVKGKIGQAFEYYLPVVTSEIGAEGMFLIDRKNALLAESAEEFATRITELYDNKETWLTLQHHSEESLYPFSPQELHKKIREIENI